MEDSDVKTLVALDLGPLMHSQKSCSRLHCQLDKMLHENLQGNIVGDDH